MERGAKVSGSRFYFLTGVGALLQLGLLQLAVAVGRRQRLHPDDPAGAGAPGVDGGHRVPRRARRGGLPARGDDLYLVGTSEVPLAGYHADEILDLSDGPRRYAGWSSCFRREAGCYGKDTRGIIRVHQFDKVEMFIYCAPDDAQPSTTGCCLGAADARVDRGALPGDRRGGR